VNAQAILFDLQHAQLVVRKQLCKLAYFIYLHRILSHCVFFLSQAVAKQWIADGQGGKIINIASMSSYHPLTNTVAYCGAKAAVANFTEWMATHFNQNYSNDIRVNAIAPGFLLTNQNRYLLTNEDGSATDRGQRVLAKTPMGRYGEPVEMAGPVMFLCSEAASFINGAVLPVDGGFSSYWGV